MHDLVHDAFEVLALVAMFLALAVMFGAAGLSQLP